MRTRTQLLLHLLAHSSKLHPYYNWRMLAEHSREESEFIIAVVVIGRSLYLEVIEVFFVPAGSKSDTHGKQIFHMWHSCTHYAVRCTMPGHACIASGRDKLTETNLRVGIVDQLGARGIPGRWRRGTSSD